MHIVLITGLSGAGKSVAARCMEDIGYYCVDNIPPVLIPKFVELCQNAKKNIKRVAMVSDLREISMSYPLEETIKKLNEGVNKCTVLFLDSDDEVLITRYKQSRRKHPLADNVGLLEAILKEKILLKNIKKQADYVINTSEKSEADLKNEINNIFKNDYKENPMVISIVSFGFKYGLPLDADLVFDVRFLPNPFYIKELKLHTGLEKCVSDYVLNFEESQIFIRKLIEMIDYLIPRYVREGKLQLTIAIGCTGGKHRSVTIAKELFSHLEKQNQNTVMSHRDINKNKSKA